MADKNTQAAAAAEPLAAEDVALHTLKLGRIGRESKLEDTPQFRGALAKVEHLVEEVEEGSDARSKPASKTASSKGSDPSEGSK